MWKTTCQFTPLVNVRPEAGHNDGRKPGIPFFLLQLMHPCIRCCLRHSFVVMENTTQWKTDGIVLVPPKDMILCWVGTQAHCMSTCVPGISFDRRPPLPTTGPNIFICCPHRLHSTWVSNGTFLNDPQSLAQIFGRIDFLSGLCCTTMFGMCWGLSLQN